jgi:hypothetical protein
MGTIPLIGLEGVHEATVDDDDLAVVLPLGPWYVRPHGRTFYAQANITRDGKRTAIYLHRLIAGLDGPMVDHRNRNGLDCRRANLRAASSTQNQVNAGVRTGRRFKGVTFTKGGWQTRVAGKYVGRFQSAEDAAMAYKRAAVERFGEFALLNEAHG